MKSSDTDTDTDTDFHLLQHTSFLLLGFCFLSLLASTESLLITKDPDDYSTPIETRRSVLRKWVNDNSSPYNKVELTLGWAVERRLVLTEAQTRVGGPKITPVERWNAMIDDSGAVCSNNNDNTTPIHHYGEMNGSMQIVSDWSHDAVNNVGEYNGIPAGAATGSQTTTTTGTEFTLPDNRQRQSKAGGVISGSLWNSAVAGSILFRSPRIRSMMKGKTILELGSGLGLGGLAASTAPQETQHCVLTDKDDDAIEELRATIGRNTPMGQECEVRKLDWYDFVRPSANEQTTGRKDEQQFYDILIATDVTYNPVLVGPFLKTAKAHLKRGNTTDCLMLIVGQANRKSHWDLHRCIRDGCFDNSTQESHLPWKGETFMLLYELVVGVWDEEEGCTAASNCTAFPREVEEVVAIAVSVHTCDAGTMSSIIGPYDHIVLHGDYSFHAS